MYMRWIFLHLDLIYLNDSNSNNLKNQNLDLNYQKCCLKKYMFQLNLKWQKSFKKIELKKNSFI